MKSIQTPPVAAATDAATSGFKKAPITGPIRIPSENDAMMVPKADALQWLCKAACQCDIALHFPSSSAVGSCSFVQPVCRTKWKHAAAHR